MIKYIEGDLFSSPAQVIVNTINIVGVMGKGLALSFKERYPEMFEFYKKACDDKKINIGNLLLWRAIDHWLLLFPTKKHWRSDSKLEYIEAGLQKFVGIYDQQGITSAAFPCLGCGNGGLNWQDVKPLMEKYLGVLPIDIYVYVAPYGNEKSNFKKAGEFIKWLNENARDMSFDGLLTDIKYCGSMIVPYEFIYEGKKAFAEEIDDVLHLKTSDSDKLVLSHNELFEIWDDIKRQKIVTVSSDNQQSDIFFQLLVSLGYLTNIRLLQSNGEKIEGYQVNEALGRAFLVQ